MNQQITIAIFGTTGDVGSHFVNQAVDAGYKLNVFVRTRAKFTQSENPNIKIFEGDATHYDAVEQAVAGADVVVSCLGNVKNVRIMYTAYDNILNAAAKQQKPPRCIMISTIGCGDSSWIIKQTLTLINGKAGFNDYERADKRVRDESRVSSVLVRPGALTNKPGKGGYKVLKGRNGTFAKPISRADVALFFLHCVEDTQWDSRPSVMIGGK